MEIWTLIAGLILVVLCGTYLLLIGFFTYGWYRKKPDASVEGSVSNKSVSVIVAARNEGRTIGRLLTDLAAQDYQAGLVEIIIVDDHSSDDTITIAGRFRDKEEKLSIGIFRTGEFNVSGKKAALDLGIRQAQGEIVLTTDADCRLEPGWIVSMVSSFIDERIRMVFGPVVINPGKNFWERFQSLEFSGLVASGAGAAGAGRPFLCNGACLAYRREAFLETDGFRGNEEYVSGDDVFLLHKMKKRYGNNAIVFCRDKKALVKTDPVQGIYRFLHQRARWASKSTGYSDPLSVATAITVFSYSLAILMSATAGIFYPLMLIPAAGLFILKMIADLPLMAGITRFTGQERLMKWYLLFQLIYPFYIVTAALMSFFKRKAW